jgi:Fe-S-cluster containining protein
VPISRDEAVALARLVDAFEPDRRSRVLARFAEAVAELQRRGALEDLRRFDQIEDAAERRRIGLEYFRFGIACPFLEDESCSIHPDRPTICREYLVVSPAEHCSHPGEGKIEQVTLRARPSITLYKFRAEGPSAESHFLPLVLLLEWAARRDGDAEPSLAGPTLLRKFLREMSTKGEPPAGEPARTADP